MTREEFEVQVDAVRITMKNQAEKWVYRYANTNAIDVSGLSPDDYEMAQNVMIAMLEDQAAWWRGHRNRKKSRIINNIRRMT